MDSPLPTPTPTAPTAIPSPAPISPRSASENSEPNQKTKPHTTTLIGVLVVIIIGLTSYLAYDKFFANKSTPTPSPTPLVSPQPQTATDDPTSNWRLITKKFWSLKVPSTWNYLECSDELLFVGSGITKDSTEQCAFDGSPGTIQIYRTSEKKYATIPELTSENPIVSERKNVTIDSIAALQQREVTLDGQGQGDRIVTYASRNGYYYTITLHEQTQQNILDQILKTFHFVDASTSSSKTNYTIPLYNLALYLPQNWTITEVNRRPEPTNPGDPVNGHDCAEYTIANPNQNSLSLKPTCGFDDGGASDQPSGAVTVKMLSKNSSIIRFPTKENNIGYGTGYKSPELTISGTDQLYTDKITIDKSGVIGSGSGNIMFITIRANYHGSADQAPAFFTETDKIVSSLKLL